MGGSVRVRGLSKQAADLVDDQGTDIAEACHIRPGKYGPAPAIGLPADGRQGCSALQAPGVEDQQAKHHGQGENRPAIRPFGSP